MEAETKILHVEVGGSYGGSLRALELYLAHCNRAQLIHDVLFYYPTPNMERLSPHVRKISTLYATVPAWLSGSPGAQPRSKSSVRRLLRRPSVAALRNWISLIKQLPEASRLARFIRSGGYEIVHINNTFTYQVPTLVGAKLASVPVVAHVRNPVPNSQFARFLARRANCLVSVAEVHSENLRKMDGSLRVVTCHDAVERVSVDPKSSRALRDSLLGDGEVLIGSLGRLDPQKGFEFLIRAAARVVVRSTECPICDRWRWRPENRARRPRRLPGFAGTFPPCRLSFRSGQLPSRPGYFICSSLWEGGPLTFVEAMQLGKPVFQLPWEWS